MHGEIATNFRGLVEIQLTTLLSVMAAMLIVAAR
jgi:hypothetical protein